MNRNLDGTALSRTQLIDLAVASGHDRSKFTIDVKTGMIVHLSRNLRFGMFSRGELLLDTRHEDLPARAPLTLDREVLAFLGVTV